MKLRKEQMENDKKEGILLISIFSFLVVLIYLMNIYDIKLMCIFKEITGFYCPGCGTTRLLKSLFKLEIKQAFMYNPIVFILMPFIGIYFIDRIRISLFNKISFIPLKINKVFWNIALLITIIFGILRNIPMFDFLRP